MPSNNRTSSSRSGSRSDSSNGGSSDSKMRGTPTDKMLRYAERIADDLDMDLPNDVPESFDACREFIDTYGDKVPPTEKQVKLANSVAEEAGVKIPRDVLASKRKLSAWLDENMGNNG